MAKKRKPKLGAKGPTPAWLRLSVAQRAALKEDIKRGFQGEERNGIKIPSARRIFEGYQSKDGYDLRHIERWTPAQLRRVRHDLAAIRTLASRSFDVKTPSTKSQRKRLVSYTGQNRKRIRSFIVHVPQGQRILFVKGQLTEVKAHAGRKERSFRRLYLFEDYSDGFKPSTFAEMADITMRMLPDMPDKIKGRAVFYALNSISLGAIGNYVRKSRVLDLLSEFHTRYDNSNQHKGFGEAINGFVMSGTEVQIKKREAEKRKYKSFYDPTKKLKFSDSTKGKRRVAKQTRVTKEVRKSLGLRSKRRSARR